MKRLLIFLSSFVVVTSREETLDFE